MLLTGSLLLDRSAVDLTVDLLFDGKYMIVS